MKPHGGSRGIALLIPNLGTRSRWSVSFMLQLLCPWEEPWYPLNRSLDGPQSQSRCSWEEECLWALLRFGPPFVQPVAQPLYWLRYPDSFQTVNGFSIELNTHSSFAFQYLTRAIFFHADSLCSVVPCQCLDSKLDTSSFAKVLLIFSCVWRCSVLW